MNIRKEVNLKLEQLNELLISVKLQDNDVKIINREIQNIFYSFTLAHVDYALKK